MSHSRRREFENKCSPLAVKSSELDACFAGLFETWKQRGMEINLVTFPNPSMAFVPSDILFSDHTGGTHEQMIAKRHFLWNAWRVSDVASFCVFFKFRNFFQTATTKTDTTVVGHRNQNQPQRLQHQRHDCFL